MFSLTGAPVTFVGLLILFGWCVVWGFVELRRPHSRTHVISQALHALMAVVMLLMVAPVTWHVVTMVVPTSVWAGVFLVAAGWYGWQAVASRREKPALLHYLGHTAMFVAMAWHLAAMALMSARHAGPGAHDSSMMHASEPGGPLWTVALAGLPLMAFLAVASLHFLRMAVLPPAGAAMPGCHEPRPVGSRDQRLGALSDFAMHAGMFWMSTGLLTPLLPFMAALRF